MRRLLPLVLVPTLACGGAALEDPNTDDALDGVAAVPELTREQRVNVTDMLDHATRDELDAIPSVSRAIAERIISRRPFASDPSPIIALDRVHGVGPTIIRNFRDNVDAMWCALQDGRQHCARPTSPPPSAVVLNEYFPGSNGWIEIYNGGSSAIDLSGWSVDDSEGGGQPRAIHSLPIAAGDWLLVQYASINTASADRVRLLDAAGRVIDEVTTPWNGASIAGACFGRTSDGGAWSAQALPCTPGSGRTASPPSIPTSIDCSALHGGTFDGVVFSADEECRAVQFIDYARYSEMGALTDAGRRIAYDCSPSGSCGVRSSEWSTLRQFSDYAGIGRSTIDALKTAISAWTRNGLAYDTVAAVWANRAAHVDLPVSFDNVLVTRRLPDQTGTYTFSCAEVKDDESATGYLTVCLQYINADSAPGCTAHPGTCLDAVVGTHASIRGTLRRSSTSTGGYRVNLLSDGPGAANPNVH